MEQKNGAVVRRLVGYGRLSGTNAKNARAQLYASSRLYINFFQPSFKLKSKTRDGARVHKVYLAPATPCDRLLAHDSVEPAIKERLKAQFNSFDPVRLLQEMRTAQQTLSEFADRLATMVPDVYARRTQLRTLHRRVNAWRAERVREMVLGSMRQCAETQTEM